MNDLSVSKLPNRIGKLGELAFNSWQSWHGDAQDMFKSLDRFLWKVTSHNPVKLLQQIEFYDQVLELFVPASVSTSIQGLRWNRQALPKSEHLRK